MIKIEHLTAGYGKHRILKDLTLTIPEHSITGIIGPNGSGKSTLLKSFFRLADITNGDISLNDISILKMNEKQLAKMMSYLSQHHAKPSISVERMVLHGRFPHLNYPRSYTSIDYAICEKAMAQAGILSLRNKNVSSLSGGEMQKVFLAMAYAKEAEIYLFDEPTTYLDVSCQINLLHAMTELKKEGKTIITVLHDLNYALNISEQLVVMDKGQIIAYGSPDEIYGSHIIDEVFGVSMQKLKDSYGNFHYVTTL